MDEILVDTKKDLLKVMGNEKRRWVGKVANDQNMLGTMVIDVLFSFNLADILK